MAPRPTGDCVLPMPSPPPPFGEAGLSPPPQPLPHTPAPAPRTRRSHHCSARRTRRMRTRGPPIPGAFAQLCEACTTESPLWFVHGEEADRERCSPRPAGWGLVPHFRRTRAAHRAASSWPVALRSPACYRTPTPDLLVGLDGFEPTGAVGDWRRRTGGSGRRSVRARRTIHTKAISLLRKEVCQPR